MNKLNYKNFYKIPGIYKITNTINNKFYIGSSVNLYNRNRSHIHKLMNKIHPNKKLQNSINKYGIDSFSFEIILNKCHVKELLILEGFYITKLKPEYNIDNVDLKGKKHCNDSTKKLIGEKSKQKFINNPALLEQQREKMKNLGAWNKNKTEIYSKETLNKMSEAGIKNAKKRKDFKKQFDEGRKMGQIKSQKKIIQYDLNMNPIKEWNSLTDAAKALEAKSLGNFTTACKKGIKIFNSFWRLKE